MLTRVDAYGFPALPLTLLLDSESESLQIKDITGIDPVKANISTTALTQSEFFTGSSVGKRNIVLKIGLNPNWAAGETYESLRDKLYLYFMPQSPIRLRWFRTDKPTVDISGYVEACDIVMFSQDPEYTISIICPDSVFLGVTEKTISGTSSGWSTVGVTKIPLEYAGTVPTGFLLSIGATQAVQSYTGRFFLSGQPAGSLLFNGTVDSARIIEMSSVDGKKFIRNRTVSSGYIRSLLNTIAIGTKWPVIRSGHNEFYLNSDAPGMTWNIKYTERFGGL